MQILFKQDALPLKEYVIINLRLLPKLRPFTVLFYALILVGSGLAWYDFFTKAGVLFEVDDAGESWVQLYVQALPLLLGFALWWGFRRAYNSTKFLHLPVTYSFTEAGIEVISDLVQSKASWQTATKLHLLRPYALLMNSVATGYYLDLRCLDAGTEADFLALLRQHNLAVK